MKDTAGILWIYAAQGTTITAHKGVTQSVAWSVSLADKALPPVIANGVLYVVTDTAVLFAFDAVTGRQLFRGGTEIKARVTSSGLALANGHVCFATADGTLYCFGLYLEI